MFQDDENFNENVKPNSEFLNNLKNKLPEYFSKDGNFDLDKFKNNLKENNINELKDGYQLDFVGKNYARRQSGEHPNSVIVPDSQNIGGGTHNLFFTGDNLEVLRHLQGNMQNKIDVIYIDPPYNTGNNDFVYPDKFDYSDEKLKELFDLDDEQLQRLDSIKSSSSHSAWLTFIYPRLVLARKLMNDNGIIFISIDDNEYANLKEISDELFGESNFITDLIWEKTQHFGRQKINYYNNADHILVYGKNMFRNNKLQERLVESKKDEFEDAPLYNNSNNCNTLTFPVGCVEFKIPDGIYDKTSNDKYELVNPVEVLNGNNNNEFKLRFKSRWSNNNVINELKKGTNFIVKSKNFAIRAIYAEGKVSTEAPRQIIFTNTNNDSKTLSRFNEKVDVSENATSKLESLMGGDYFSYPKPVSLVKYLLSLYYKDNDFKNNITVMDFFAGSATTAEAVMELNAEDHGNRKFILAQLDEPIFKIDGSGEEFANNDSNEEAFRDGYRYIDEISLSRIKKAYRKINNTYDDTNVVNHFSVKKVSVQTSDDIEKFNPDNSNLFNDFLNDFSAKTLGIKGDATGEDTILTTWLAKDGYSFDVEKEKVKFENYQATLIDNSRLYLICDGWNEESTRILVNKLGKRELNIQTIVLFGYSFNISELKELEIALKQLDNKVNLVKRY